jgi:hypothetical protein
MFLLMKRRYFHYSKLQNTVHKIKNALTYSFKHNSRKLFHQIDYFQIALKDTTITERMLM